MADFDYLASKEPWIKYVISKISDPELRENLHPFDLEVGDDVALSLHETGGKVASASQGSVKKLKPLQQSELLREFYLMIAQGDLKKAFNEAAFTPKDLFSPDVKQPCLSTVPPPYHKSELPVIIIGAGVSGMVAAYELRKVGYEVVILEMSQRFGGRVKTLGQKDGFDRGLHVEAGAMRLPGPPPDRKVLLTDKGEVNEANIDESIHYLTDYYALNKFGLRPVPFSNVDENAYYNFYGESTKISDWDDSKFSKYWKGWDDRLQKTGRSGKIKNIVDYYEATVKVVIDSLKKRLKDVYPEDDIKARSIQWHYWTSDWSKFTLRSFLRSSYETVKKQLKFCNVDEELNYYLPWPEAAITAYTTFTYTLELEMSLVSYIQEDMGKWWSPHMHSLKGGLSALPNAFALGEGGVEECIMYNRTVYDVEYSWKNHMDKSVVVSGVFTSSGERFSIKGCSVIVTVPLNILRGMKIVNGLSEDRDPKVNKPFPVDFQQAIQDITYTPSTKIMLQYREKFWKNEDGIKGGFSKTSLPIGQVHYPTEIEGDANNEKGILLIYTWKAEALLWGGFSEDSTIHQAVRQIDDIHANVTNTKELFEVGKVQAWASDPTALGAFVKLRPLEYVHVLYLMQMCWRNVYFGGEAISFSNGWIQGALESGLRAAFQLYSDDQKYSKKKRLQD